MSKVFITSDFHFHHSSALIWAKEFRPFAHVEEMNQAIIETWNAEVRPRDLVWCLGDITWLPDDSIMEALNGTKKLVLGNHDILDLAFYQKHFVKICSIESYKGYALTHIPIHPSMFPRWKGNIHGHLHQSTIPDPRYFNVSVEQNQLAPFEFTYIESKIQKVEKP